MASSNSLHFKLDNNICYDMLLPIMRFIDNETIRLSSVGLYSSWCFHKPTRTLFDCGDGVSQNLKSKIFAVERIVLGHSHVDHIAGLLSFIGLRNKTKGANEKPLDVWVNKSDPFMVKYIRLIQEMFPQESLQYPLVFKDIRAGQTFEVGGKSYIKAFKVEHTEYSLGFCVYNKSSCLKEGIDPKTIGAKLKSGELRKEDITVQKDVRAFAYILDSFKFNVEEILDVREAVLDCTFLNEADRNAWSHASLKECLKVIEDSKCHKAYLSHVSPRYNATRSFPLVWDMASGLTLGDNPISFEKLFEAAKDLG